MSSDERMPKPEPIWFALAMIVWALAATFGPNRRARFLDSLARISGDGDTLSQVTPFRRDGQRRANMSQATTIAAGWIARLAEALRAAGR